MDESVVLPALPTYLFAPSFAGVLSLLVTVLLPLAAGLLMKQSWSTGIKGTMLLLVASIKTLLEAALAASDASASFNWATALWAVAINFGIAVTVHFGLWRGTGIQRAVINSGVTDGKATPTRR